MYRTFAGICCTLHEIVKDNAIRWCVHSRCTWQRFAAIYQQTGSHPEILWFTTECWWFVFVSFFMGATVAYFCTCHASNVPACVPLKHLLWLSETISRKGIHATNYRWRSQCYDQWRKLSRDFSTLQIGGDYVKKSTKIRWDRLKAITGKTGA